MLYIGNERLCIPKVYSCNNKKEYKCYDNTEENIINEFMFNTFLKLASKRGEKQPNKYTRKKSQLKTRKTRKKSNE